jgi:hypothetical protein
MVVRFMTVRVGASAVLIAVVGAVSACGSTPATSSSRPPTTTVPVALASLGLVPANPHLKDRIELATSSVRAGTPVDAVLMVTSRASTSINLTKTCRPQFAVVLARGASVYRIAFAQVCSSEPFTIAPGVNRIPSAVLTTYPSCGPPSGRPPTGGPACVHGGPPPLPAGSYRAVLQGSGDLALPEPSPVTVTLRPPAPSTGTTDPLTPSG